MMSRTIYLPLILLTFLVAPQALGQCTLAFEDYVFQGAFPGQTETDAVQYHTEGYGKCHNAHPDWCPPGAPIGVAVRGTFHKSYWMSSTSGAWLASPTCVPYVHNMKTSDGRIVEYACADYADDASELVWEVLPTSTFDRPRIYERNEGGVWKLGARWGNLTCQPAASLTASVFPIHHYSLRENHYECLAPDFMWWAGSSTPKGAFGYLGPTLINASNAATVAQQLKNLGIVPSYMPTNEVINPAWYGSMLQAAGRSGHPVYLTIRRDYLDLWCGSSSCKDWVETYWYLTASPGGAGQFGFGLVRWNIQSLSTGLFYNEVVFDTLVTETTTKTVARDLCEIL